jgi:L-lysine exporter family protein LysE/ArgO
VCCLAAALGSAAWFAALGFGAGRLGPFFGEPRSWRLLDAAVAAVMVALPASLLAGG